MQENNIIANQNNTNLIKAETTYFSNLTCLKDIMEIVDDKAGHLDQVEAQEQLKIMAQEIQDSIKNSAINNKRIYIKTIERKI